MKREEIGVGKKLTSHEVVEKKRKAGDQLRQLGEGGRGVGRNRQRTARAGAGVEASSMVTKGEVRGKEGGGFRFGRLGRRGRVWGKPIF